MSLTKIPPEIRTEIFDAAQHRSDPSKFQCAGCRKYFSRPALEIDHIVPEAESFPGQRLDRDNLQLLCAPKGSNRFTSCHKKKTAAERASRARRNRPPKDWRPFGCYLAADVVVFGYAWEVVFQHDVDAANHWAAYSSAGLVIAFSTYLVQKRFRHRRPRKATSVTPESKVQARGVDSDRILEAAREVINSAKGSISLVQQSYGFDLSYVGTGFADHIDDRKFELLSKIQAKTGERWLPTWHTKIDKVQFAKRPELERMVRHPGFDPKRKWHELPIAPGVQLDLKVTPHVLIIGTTGAGKTALMRTLITAVADSARKDNNTRTILADPKLIEMPGFVGWPGISEVVGEPHELWDMALDLEAEMWDRLRLIKAKKAKTSDFKKIIVVIDEYEQFFKRMDDYWRTMKDDEGKPLKKPGQRFPDAISSIQTILSMARRVNIHIIIGTQSPDAAWFGGTGTRENMSGRAAVGPVDSVRARMMFDDSSVGRDIPVEFKGRATVQVGDGLPQEVQCYYTPDPFDPDGDNGPEDWDHLVRLGMPRELVPV